LTATEDYFGFVENDLVKLESLDDSHHDALYKISFDEKIKHLWAPNLSAMSKARFIRYLIRRIEHRWSHFKVIVRQRDGAVIGFAYSYNECAMNKLGSICLCLKSELMNTRYGIFASYLFVSHLFVDQEYRKIYCEVFSYNKNCNDLLNRLGFQCEGRLQDHQLWNDQYWDLCLYGVTYR
jgi:RimJ/RimL family protein N-acetyltransferase